jgi:hypothetical protein
MQTVEMISVNDLAKELDVTAKEVILYLPSIAVGGKKSHSSLLEQHVADRVRDYFEKPFAEQTTEERFDSWIRKQEEPADERCYIVKEPQGEPYPIGFFYAQTREGKSAGFGWSCYDCHQSIAFGAPHEIRHCGDKMDVLDTRAPMLTHVLGSHKTYREVRVKDPAAIIEHDLFVARRKREREIEAAAQARKDNAAKGHSRVRVWFEGLWD